jgi:hypothetical protein
MEIHVSPENPRLAFIRIGLNNLLFLPTKQPRLGNWIGVPDAKEDRRTGEDKLDSALSALQHLSAYH